MYSQGLVMEISFRTNKLAKIFASEKLLIRTYGKDQADVIKKRRDFLAASPTLSDVPIQPPYRRHELKGQRKEQFAVDLKHPMRLVFEPNHHPLPRKEDEGLDLTRITAITIIDVEDYH